MNKRKEALSSDFSFIVQNDEKGQRLDYFLSRKWAELSRNQLKKAIQEGNVLVNGRIIKLHYLSKVGDGTKRRISMATLEWDRDVSMQ